MRFLERYNETLYAIFRIIFGMLFASHGAQKVFGVLGGQKAGAPLMVAAGWIELVTGILITVGLFTGIAAFIASGEMAVAYFMAHAPNGFWPLVNHGEPAVLYGFAFLYMASRGSGLLSVDAVRVKAPGSMPPPSLRRRPFPSAD
jgi:putative oxidoreductase